MSDEIKGPYEFDIHVHITDGRKRGKITISASMGDLPTQQDLDKVLKIAEETAKEAGCRLMTQNEFLNQMIRERLGGRSEFANPEDEE